MLQKVIRDFNAIFSNPSLSAKEKINSALVFDPSGRPGADLVRARQYKISSSLAEFRKTLNSKPMLKNVWTLKQNSRKSHPDEKRMKNSGDQEFAHKLAKAYHLRVETLHQSSDADIVYGPGGQQTIDWNYYSKSYKYPKKYLNSGYYVRYIENKCFVELYNFRGTKKATLPVPEKKERKKIIFNSDDYRYSSNNNSYGATYPLIGGDLFGILRHKNVIERKGVRKVRGEDKWEYFTTGFAALVQGKNGLYWEHGRTLKEIKLEIEHKRNAEELRKLQEIKNRKVLRAASLISKLCPNLQVKREHARSLGYCNAGIDGYCGQYGLSKDVSTAKEIRATGNPTAIKTIYIAALDVAKNLVAKRCNAKNRLTN